jgi:hypothetical protein
MVFRTPDWRRAVDKKLAAEKIRALLEKRIADILGCQPSELPYMNVAMLVHFAFLLKGNFHELGGFGASMEAILKTLGNDIAWGVEPKTEAETAKPEVID